MFAQLFLVQIAILYYHDWVLWVNLKEDTNCYKKCGKTKMKYLTAFKIIQKAVVSANNNNQIIIR